VNGGDPVCGPMGRGRRPEGEGGWSIVKTRRDDQCLNQLGERSKACEEERGKCLRGGTRKSRPRDRRSRS